MRKNASADSIRKWKAMDAERADPFGLYVAGFARKWKVSTKTVRRDVAALRQLAQRMVRKPLDEAPQWEVFDHFWKYERGVEPLFVSNLSEWVRKADFDTNDHLRIHQQNRYPVKWLLARMAGQLERLCVVAPVFSSVSATPPRNLCGRRPAAIDARPDPIVVPLHPCIGDPTLAEKPLPVHVFAAAPLKT
jgi:hypothetical protein